MRVSFAASLLVAFTATGAAAQPQPATVELAASEPMLLAQASLDAEREVRLIKTAYLYNFLKFVRWPPAQDGAALTVCITRDPELARTAQAALRDKRVAEQVVAVAAAPGPGCALLYSPGGAAPAAAGVLTVGEGRDFVEDGGMIGFAIVDDRVRFFVNLKALRAAGLSADARLLTVALEVLQ